MVIETGFKRGKKIYGNKDLECVLSEELGEQYNIFRLDRENANGGIAVFTRKTVNVEIIKEDFENEQLWLYVHLCTVRVQLLDSATKTRKIQ